MEEKNQELGDVSPYDVEEAVRALQLQNRIFEGRFSAIGESLIKLNSGIETIKQLMSPILPETDDQKSIESGEQAVDMGNIFPNNEDEEVNLSFRCGRQPSG